MKAFKILGALLVVLVIAGAIAYLVLNRHDDAPGKAPALAGASGPDPVARGEYLAQAADCVACHTVPGGQPFAGGLAFKLPFGTLYASNITADAETGIGSWSEDDFVRAVREGIAKDGSRLYPVFPYTSYTLMSRDDVLAIKAYLFSLPKVRASVPGNDLAFPFNQRWVLGFWNAAFFRSRRFAGDPGQSEAWNRGAYLAALGHCGECHTPRNAGYGLDHGREFAGAEQQGWRAYNISSDARFGIGAWSAQDLQAYLHTGHADGRGSASGPMGEVIENSLRHLAPADIDALATFVRAVPPQRSGIQAPQELAAATGGPDDAGLGQHVFVGACIGCHQLDGNGLQSGYAGLNGTRGVRDGTGTNVSLVVLQGSSLSSGGPAARMPSFAAGYSDAEIAAVTNYVIHRFGNVRGQVTASDIASRRQQ